MENIEKLTEWFTEQDENGNYNEMQKLKETLAKFIKYRDSGNDEKADELFECVCHLLSMCAMVGAQTNTTVLGESVTKTDIRKLAEGRFDETTSEVEIATLQMDEQDGELVPVYTSLDEDTFSGTMENTYRAKFDVGTLITYAQNFESIEGLIINPASDCVIIPRDCLNIMMDVLEEANKDIED